MKVHEGEVPVLQPPPTVNKGFSCQTLTTIHFVQASTWGASDVTSNTEKNLTTPKDERLEPKKSPSFHPAGKSSKKPKPSHDFGNSSHELSGDIGGYTSCQGPRWRITEPSRPHLATRA